MKTVDFSSKATSAILDDLAFFCSEAGSKRGSDEAHYTKQGVINRYSAISFMPTFNGIIPTDPKTLDISPELIQEQISFFNNLSIPHVWWLLSAEQKESIGPKLEEQGYTSGGTYLGYAQLAENISDIKLPKMPKSSSISVKEVETEEEYHAFCSVVGQIFQFDKPTGEKFLKLMKDFGKGKVYRHVIASIDNKVVGVMSAMLRNGWCGAWNGGVLPEARGAGVGRALCLKMKEIGNEEQVIGYSGILMAAANAKGLAQKFGGEKVCEIYPYLYGIKSEDFEP